MRKMLFIFFFLFFKQTEWCQHAVTGENCVVVCRSWCLVNWSSANKKELRDIPWWVQWLRLCNFIAKSVGLIPGQGT